MRLKGKKAVVLAENIYEDLELWYPYYRLREEGAEVLIAGTGSSETYTGKHGYPLKVNTSADKVRAEDFDCVIIPGGYAPDHMRRYPAVLNLVKGALERGAVVGAICHAGWVLVSANVLKGRKVTCYVAIKDDIINAGAEYTDAEVIRDGNLITSRRPADLPAFMREIIAAMSGS
ncbi:MAG: type 1 glutamine amidotransferase domain-containing protein [Deltaproteobacteria bacterium]